MTDLYIKQHVFTIGERFTVYGEDGSERFYVEGEVFSLPKTFHISDAAGNEVAEISRRLFSFPVKYDVSADGCDVTISKKNNVYISVLYGRRTWLADRGRIFESRIRNYKRRRRSRNGIEGVVYVRRRLSSARNERRRRTYGALRTYCYRRLPCDVE